MNKKVIIMIVIAAVVLYFIFTSQPAAAAPAAAPAPTPPSPPTGPGQMQTPGGTSLSPGTSLPAPVSVPSPVSAQTDPLVTPVTIPAPIASFTPGVASDAVTQGSAGTIAVAATAANNLPSGFQAWYNSLGPVNQAYIAGLIPTMPASDINFIDSIVKGNLWGQASIQSQWNAFVAKYGLPQNGSFSNFNGPKRKRK